MLEKVMCEFRGYTNCTSNNVDYECKSSLLSNTRVRDKIRNQIRKKYRHINEK